LQNILLKLVASDDEQQNVDNIKEVEEVLKSSEQALKLKSNHETNFLPL
jgi:hypothetical protein